MFGWGEKDKTTKEERDAWKDNAKSQMNGNDDSDESTNDKQQPRHARRNKW